MLEAKSKCVNVSSENELLALIDRINSGSIFADTFHFKTDQLFERLLDSLGIPVQEFEEKWNYHSEDEQLIISYSSEGYVLISTMGLVSREKASDNLYVNAFFMQSVVLRLLINEAFRLLDQEDVYDIDSNNYEQICNLTPALFHNLLFFYETLAKSYLALSNRAIPRKHTLELLLLRVKETMVELNQTDTMFHTLIIPWFEEAVRYIKSIPGEFREQYVKYDSNPNDTTVFRFTHLALGDLRNMLELSLDFISQLSYSEKTCYLPEKDTSKNY